MGGARILVSESKNLKVSAFIQLIQNIEDQVHGTNIDESIDLINSQSGLKDHYLKDKDGSSRVENLNELVSAAKSFLNEVKEKFLMKIQIKSNHSHWLSFLILPH